MAGTFHGTFGDFDAAVTDGVLNGNAKVGSVQVKDDNLAAHLQSPDFFDAQTP
jgi:polyisoprenoid-binding protein YceI